MNVESEKCSLCRQIAPLRKGHLIPNFIISFIKRTSGTGKLRGGNYPNKRKQDVLKQNILCAECEILFSTWENYFAKQIFKPCWREIVDEIDYDERLKRFLVSLTWRQIQWHLQESIWPTIVHKRAMVTTEKIFRQYLLGSSSRLSIDHHLWKVSPFSDVDPIVNGTVLDVNWYIYRSVDGTIAQDNKRCFIYVLIPGFVIVTALTEHVLAGMEGTKISNSGRLIFAKQKPDAELQQFILKRARQALSPQAKLSSRQKKIIDRDHEINKQKLLNNAPYYFFLEYSSKSNNK